MPTTATNDDTGLVVPSDSQTVNGPISIIGTLTATQIGRTWYAHTFATAGTGTSADPWTGWEATVNALPANSHVHFAAGSYTLALMITMKRGWLVTGDGVDTTIITTAIAGTAFRTNFPIPNSQLAYVAVRDLYLICTNIANNGSGLLETNGSFVEWSNLKIIGFRYGMSFVGSEVVQIDHCETSHQTRAGMWLVNGDSYNLTNADIDLSANPTFTTNLIRVSNCQINQLGFNQTFVNIAIGIAHDGGWTFQVDNTNFNGCTNQLRLAGVNWTSINTCEFEASFDDTITIGFNKLNNDGSSGPSGPVKLDSNLVVAGTANKYAIRIASLTRLVLMNNLLRQGAGAASAIVGCANVNSIQNIGSYTDAAGLLLYDVRTTAILDLTPVVVGTDGAVMDLSQSGNFINSLYVRNTDAVSTGSAARIAATADVANLDIRAHGSGRVISRWGVTLARWAEMLTSAGLGLAIGTQGAFPLILGTNSVARVKIGGAGEISLFALPVFADNAAALSGGLVAGGLYRTGADPDPVMVVH